MMAEIRDECIGGIRDECVGDDQESDFFLVITFFADNY